MHAIKAQQFAHRLYAKKVPFVPRLITWITFHLCHCDLAAKTVIGRGTSLGHKGLGIVINQNSVIGENCIIAQNVTLAGGKGGSPVMGDYIYVGCNSVIYGGVNIGDNVTIGACSFVNKDIPSNAVAVGVPAKVIRIKDENEILEHRRKLGNR